MIMQHCHVVVDQMIKVVGRLIARSPLEEESPNLLIRHAERHRHTCCCIMQVHNETVQLHLVAALQSLHREAQLLPSSQREVLGVVLREHGLGTAAQTRTSQPALHRKSFTVSSTGNESSEDFLLLEDNMLQGRVMCRQTSFTSVPYLCCLHP